MVALHDRPCLDPDCIECRAWTINHASRVLKARAELALNDPEGEADALHPMTEQEAFAMWDRAEALRGRSSYVLTVPNESFVARLGIRPAMRQGVIRCPAHDDQKPSLSYRWTPEGALLLHCFAGCRWDDIRAATRG